MVFLAGGFGGPGWFPSGLALDSVNSLLYWGDIGVIFNAPNGSVNRMTTTGAAQTQLTPHVDGRGRGYALDQASQTIFLTAHDPTLPGSGGGLFSYDIASTTETQLISDPGTGYWDIEIDPIGQRIWWTDYGRGQILSAKFDGSDVQIELSGLTNPYGLALELELETEVDLDVNPTSCPNPLNVKSKGVLPAAITGSETLDVNDIDVATLRLEGVSPLRSAIEDVAAPFASDIQDPPERDDCTTDGPDGFTDLTLKFDTQAIVAALGAVNDGDVLVLTLTGELLDGTPIEGQDVVWIKQKGK
jgi:DNA-binding beta-propeller fold protein YncE